MAVFLPGKFHEQRSLVAAVHGISKSQTQLGLHTCHVRQIENMQEMFNKDLEELRNKQSTINNKITEIKNTLEETKASLVAKLVKNQQ